MLTSCFRYGVLFWGRLVVSYWEVFLEVFDRVKLALDLGFYMDRGSSLVSVFRLGFYVVFGRVKVRGLWDYALWSWLIDTRFFLAVELILRDFLSFSLFNLSN